MQIFRETKRRGVAWLRVARRGSCSVAQVAHAFIACVVMTRSEEWRYVRTTQDALITTIAESCSAFVEHASDTGTTYMGAAAPEAVT